jgi:hypothetical protein
MGILPEDAREAEFKMDDETSRIINSFHNLYYSGPRGEGIIFQRTRWMGVPCQKCPLDLWIYQEIFHEIRPDLVIETGTAAGGAPDDVQLQGFLKRVEYHAFVEVKPPAGCCFDCGRFESGGAVRH